MEHRTMNIINLDAYREQKARKRTATKPAFMMCWVMFVPTMP